MQVFFFNIHIDVFYVSIVCACGTNILWPCIYYQGTEQYLLTQAKDNISMSIPIRNMPYTHSHHLSQAIEAALCLYSVIFNVKKIQSRDI